MATRSTRKPVDNAAETAPVPEALDMPENVTDFAAAQEAKALAKRDRVDDETLRNIASFEDAFALATELYGDVTDVTEELGNGFTLITDKAPLVGKEMIVVSCAFSDGDFGQFASVAAVTKDGGKFIFNDGSTGVYNQLFELVRTKKRTGGFHLPSGLTASTYPTCPPSDGGCSRARPNGMKVCQHCGNESERRSEGTTYFINLAPASSS
jgi:hypothetical protein